MRAMVMDGPGGPLRAAELPAPRPGGGQLLLRVLACGVCRTDLHIVDAELKEPKLPLIPGHQIVGEVLESGEGVRRFRPGDRVGVPWLGWTCGRCRFCASERENLCDEARFTGYQIDGGFAELAVADERFCFRIPESVSAAQAAPLLCAGLIGHRSLVLAGEAQRLGIYGFGAAAHIVIQVARHQGRDTYAFVRPDDRVSRDFAQDMGATWAGYSDQPPPEPLDAALVFAPVGALVPLALRAVVKGGVVVCGGIHMSDIPSFPYSLLWGERILRSVANLTRRDGEEFLALAEQIPVRTKVSPYPLDRTNQALQDLRTGRLQGAAVVVFA